MRSYLAQEMPFAARMAQANRWLTGKAPSVEVREDPRDQCPDAHHHRVDHDRRRRQAEHGAVVAPGLVIGRTDSRHYGPIADDSYRFLPMRLTHSDLPRIHDTDERIAIDDFVEIIRFYVQLWWNTLSDSAE